MTLSISRFFCLVECNTGGTMTLSVSIFLSGRLCVQLLGGQSTKGTKEVQAVI